MVQEYFTRIRAFSQALENLEASGRVLTIRPPAPITISHMEKDVDKLRALYDEGRAVGKEALLRLR
ncbi:MAG: DUF6363 domain-containing protein [Oscillospiraceae bacterium]